MDDTLVNQPPLPQTDNSTTPMPAPPAQMPVAAELTPPIPGSPITDDAAAAQLSEHYKAIMTDLAQPAPPTTTVTQQAQPTQSPLPTPPSVAAPQTPPPAIATQPVEVAQPEIAVPATSSDQPVQ